MAESMTKQLELLKIVGYQVEGGSFDGQYFHLSISEHLQELLNKALPILCTWDPLHRIGVKETHIRNYQIFSWLVALTQTCQQIYMKFNWGGNCQALVEK